MSLKIFFIFKAADDNSAQLALTSRGIRTATFLRKDRYEFHYECESWEREKVFSWYHETEEALDFPMGTCLFYFIIICTLGSVLIICGVLIICTIFITRIIRLLSHLFLFRLVVCVTITIRNLAIMNLNRFLYFIVLCFILS